MYVKVIVTPLRQAVQSSILKLAARASFEQLRCIFFSCATPAKCGTRELLKKTGILEVAL